MRLLIFILCSFLLNISYAQESGVIDTGELPFKYRKGAILIPVSIKGEVYDFILDTDGYMTIGKEVSTAGNFAAAGSLEVSDIKSNTRTFEKVIVPNLQLGNWTISSREAIVDNNYGSYPNRCFGASGMIGRDLLKDVLIQFNYRDKVVRITNQADQLSLNKAHRNKMKISKRGLPAFRTKIDGNTRFIEFDSGSRDWFSFQSSALAKRLSKANDTKIKSYSGVFSFGVSGMDLTPESRYRARVDRLSLGPVIFQNSLSDLSKVTAPRFGSGILEHGILTLDFINNHFYFVGFESMVNNLDREPLGFAVAKIKGVYLIKWVEVASSANEAGIKPGDRILAINGRNVESWGDECELYLNGYSFLSEADIQLSLQTVEGEKKEVRLEKEKP